MQSTQKEIIMPKLPNITTRTTTKKPKKKTNKIYTRIISNEYIYLLNMTANIYKKKNSNKLQCENETKLSMTLFIINRNQKKICFI